MTRGVKIRSAGTALNIAENAKTSKSSLKITEYLWELKSGIKLYFSYSNKRCMNFLYAALLSVD